MAPFHARTLLLTDSVIIDRMIISGFEKANHTILSVQSKDADCFAKIMEFQPDLVFIKAELNHAQGIEISDRLRRQETTKNAKIIFLSSNPNMREQAIQHRVSRFLSLPFTLQDIRLAVELLTTEKFKVLYVDDSDMMHQVVVPALRDEGYEVWEAWDGREAVELLDKAAGKVDLILSDVEMPTMNGHQLCRSVRSSFPEDIPFILLTSLDTEEAIVQGFEAGADDYLLKPVVLPELLDRVKRWLSDRHVHKVVRTERILVVDDSPAIRILITKALGTQGFSVDEAEDGQAALAQLREKEYHLLITDYEMPQMDGLELCQRIRQGETGQSNLPIVFATSRTSKTDTVKMRSIGVQAVIAKPFTPDRVAAEVERVLGELVLQRRRHLIQHLFPERMLASTTGQHTLDQSGQDPTFADDQFRTLLSARIVNLPELSKYLKSQEVVTQINQYLACVAQVLELFDLPVEQLSEERILVSLSGQEADIIRAIRVAVTMTNAVFSLNQTSGYALQLGVVLHSGHVILGNTGIKSLGRQLTLLGEGIQVIRAIRNEVREAGIFLSAPCLKQVASFVEVEPFGSVNVPERGESVEVLRMIKLKEG
ncbi:MAG: response regulator [Magnetococcales bacterium]|nr:response regulator [Magnetococcales bacterium]